MGELMADSTAKLTSAVRYIHVTVYTISVASYLMYDFAQFTVQLLEPGHLEKS